LHKDGKPLDVALTVSPIRDERGQVIETSTVAHDLSQRRHLEDQLLQAQRIEAIGMLAGGVAHDFNNLLTIINGYSELLQRTLPPDVPGQDMVREILRSGERAASLTRQLLAFSRRQKLQPVPLDLNLLVTELERLLRRLIGEDIELVTVLDPELGRILADPGQIEQVIMNLVVNARDAMPTGGTLTLETKAVELDAAGAPSRTEIKPGRYATLAVSDTGCGMDAETQARIFEPFFTTKNTGKGTGLGLSMVYGIVKHCGGLIQVCSEVGLGTTFKVFFPLHGQGRRVAAGEGPHYHVPRGTETILVAEDDEAILGLTRCVLEASGYQVLLARDGEEALRVAGAHRGPVHLLVTDVIMPRLGGRQLAERLQLLHPAMKVLYLSGYPDEAILRHGVLQSGMAFLEKPFAPAVLAIKVRQVLDANPGGRSP
jgi:signal transduction histidine kinase/CheY-like chemotaxis protein